MFREHFLPPPRGVLPPGKGGREKQDVGGHGEEGLVPGSPLFPLHPNLQSPSSRPFLKLTAWSRHETPLQSPNPARVCQLCHPLPCFLPRGGVRAPALAALEHMSPIPNNTPPRKLAKKASGALPLLGRKPNKGPPLPPFIINVLQPLDSALSFHLPWESLGVERGAPERMVAKGDRGEGDDTGAPAGL